MIVNGTIDKIKKYFDGTLQYPLLIVVSSDEYRDILNVFSSVPKIKVSSYCIGADKEPDTNKLEEDVKGLHGNYFLIGLGDYLASKNTSKAVLTPYCKEFVLQPNSHVAVILSPHMYNIVKEIRASDLRARDRIILPAFEPQIPIDVIDNTLVYGIREYLEACEDGKFIGSVKSARKISNTTVIDPDSAFDELKHTYPNEFSKLSQSMGTSEYWGILLEKLNTSKNIRQYLADQRFASSEYIFLKYAKAIDYKSWLYFIWLKLSLNAQGYLGFIVSKTENLNNLLETARDAILDISLTDNRFKDFYEQRKILLKDCTDADMADFIPQIYRHSIDRIAYLTNNTKVERQATIISLGEGAKADYIKMSYPELYAYLQDYNFDDDNMTAYFAAYKKCKISNKIDSEFADIVKSNAINRPYNILPSRSTAFAHINPTNTLLIFLDAMGVEFLGYIKEVCAELKMRFTTKIVMANLPTITSINKEFYNDWQGDKEPPIKDIDDLKHNPERGYDFDNSYPIHLSEELEVIRSALERAKVKLSKYDKIIITSDHGASRLAVIGDTAKIDCGTCEPKSSGRYCQGNSLPTAENITTEDNCAIIADYSRFSGSRIASVEVHGGATLEEVVVPVIELTLIDSNIRVKLENNTIEFSYKKPAELIVIITPDCDMVTASVNGVAYETEKLEKSRFKVTMPDLRKGTYILAVSENQNKIADMEFIIKNKGFSERNII